jgi:hypothetical protein
MKRLFAVFIAGCAVLGAGNILSTVERSLSEGHVVYRNLSPWVWLFEGIPVEATYTPSAIKSIQHINLTWGAATSVTDTINAVNWTYANISTNGEGYEAFGATSDQSMGTLTVVSSTQVGANRASNASGPIRHYSVIEWVPNLVTRVVHDISSDVAAGGWGSAATIGATVNVNKTIPLFQGCTTYNGQSGTQSRFTVRLVNSTQIIVDRSQASGGGSACTCYSGLVEFK